MFYSQAEILSENLHTVVGLKLKVEIIQRNMNIAREKNWCFAIFLITGEIFHFL